MCRSVSPTLEQVAAFAAFVQMLDIFLVLVFRNRVSCVLCVVLCCVVLCAPIARIFFSFLSTPSSICVSKTQWFPLNMLIEIAYKFREHLCSSPMSQTFVRCFLEPDFCFFSRFGVYVFFSASISISDSVSYFPWRAMHSCVRVSEYCTMVCAETASADFNAFDVCVLYLKRTKIFKSSEKCDEKSPKAHGPEHKKERKDKKNTFRTHSNE